MRRFEGKVALVTGASSGMGQATARQLAEGGARVFSAQRSRSEFETIPADFAFFDTAEAVISAVRDRAGQLDILINNAGVMREGTVEETTYAEWQLQMQVNLTAPFLLIRHA